MLNQDFREFIQLLNDNQVKYLVVGGYAVAIHGHPRYTKDIDIWVEMSEENSRKLIMVLDQFGFGSLGITDEDFQTPDQIIQLGYPPSRINLITTPDGVNFNNCYQSKVEVSIDNMMIDFIDLENLRKNKLASGRLQDLADLENLQT
ncbi:hypothetical protein FLX56_20795 [Synechococcus moorigangaii CMS01]|nr:hypothetical protein [Synechococcus moorigangaii CMS01]